MARISVIIPTHSRPGLLARAVESAQRAGTDVEVVVVDDASADETAFLCRKLSGITYVRADRNLGVAGARNLGILASSGEYLSFLDDDDLRLPHSLDLQLESLAACEEVGLVYGQAVLGDQDCAPTSRLYPDPCPRGDIFWELLERNFIPCPAALFRRSCLLRVGLLEDSIPGIDDWDLWLRITELYPVAAINQPVAVHRRATPSSDQYTANAALMIAMATRTHRRRWMKLKRVTDADAGKQRRAERLFSVNMAGHLLWEAGRALAGRRPRAALKNVSTALSLHPLGVMRRMIRPPNTRLLIHAWRARPRATGAE